METRIRDVPQEGRFEIEVDGQRVGLAQYRRGESVLALVHTEIDPDMGGRGLAGELIACALDQARASGLAVAPYCPFVRHYLITHPEYLDLIPAEDRDRFDLPAAG